MPRIPPLRLLLSLPLAALALADAPAAEGQALAPNLFYTSIEPCRIFDTRAAGGPLAPSVTHLFTVVGASSDFTLQGGHGGGCAVPGFVGGVPQVQAVVLNFVAVAPEGPGDLRVWPSDHTLPNSSILNYTSGFTIANGIVIPVRQDQEGGDIAVLAAVSGTNVLADVVGYFSSGSPTQGLDNLYLGTGAGNPGVSTGSHNTAVGISALRANTNALFDTAIGALALAGNTIGANNTAVGWSALGTNSTGSNNTAAGFRAMANCTTGEGNTAIGLGALLGLTTGRFNVAIGSNVGANLILGSNNIYINSSPSGDEDSTIRIGTNGLQGATYVAGIIGAPVAANGGPVYVDASGKLGTSLMSSLRFKEDVQNMGEQTAGLMKLRPVTFHYKPEYDGGSHLLQYGLVAEEVAQVYPELVQYGQDGKPFAVRYHVINTMLLNEVQRQHRKLEEQRVQLAELAARGANVEELQALVAEQRAQTDDGRRLAAAQKARIEELEARLAKVEAWQASQR
jgi:hypothetical protein